MKDMNLHKAPAFGNREMPRRMAEINLKRSLFRDEESSIVGRPHYALQNLRSLAPAHPARQAGRYGDPDGRQRSEVFDAIPGNQK